MAIHISFGVEADSHQESPLVYPQDSPNHMAPVHTQKKTSPNPTKNRDRQHRWFVASSPKWCTCTTSSHLKPCSPSTFNGLTIIFQAMYPIFLPEKIHHVLGISQLGPSRNSSTDGRSFLSVCFAWARGVQKTSQIFRLNHPQNRDYEVGKKKAPSNPKFLILYLQFPKGFTLRVAMFVQNMTMGWP